MKFAVTVGLVSMAISKELKTGPVVVTSSMRYKNGVSTQMSSSQTLSM